MGSRISEASSRLARLGEFVVPTMQKRDQVQKIGQMQAQLGGSTRVRISRGRFDGQAATIVTLRYSSNAVTIGVLDSRTSSQLRFCLWWKSVRRRVISAPARIELDSNSPHYLDVWVNAKPSGAVAKPRDEERF